MAGLSSGGMDAWNRMVEMASARPAFVLMRGAYDAPGERVTPGTPARTTFRLISCASTAG